LTESAACQAPEPLQAEREQRIRYAELLEDMHKLLAAYHDLRVSPKVALAPPVESKLVTGLIDQATTLAQDRHYHEAGELSTSVRAAVIVALNKLLYSTALMYDLKITLPTEEFEYEMSR
jgi:hypothetical protein